MAVSTNNRECLREVGLRVTLQAFIAHQSHWPTLNHALRRSSITAFQLSLFDAVEKVRRMIKGLRTVIYHVPDLAKAKEWYSRVREQEPYFDQPFYVGFSV